MKGREKIELESKSGGAPRTFALLIGGMVGGSLAYFFDPQAGRGRRAEAAQRINAWLRSGGESAGRMRRKLGSDSRGLTHRVVQLTSSRREPVDDKTLVDRVESEIFRDPSLPKGSLNITSESGVIILNGQLGDESQINRVETAVRKVPGVVGVENFMHVPGTPAPNKAEARRAGI